MLLLLLMMWTSYRGARVGNAVAVAHDVDLLQGCASG